MSDERDDQYINSIIRAIEILNLYKNGQTYFGITEISKLLNFHKTTVFRIVKTLESMGWLIKDEITNQYKLGLELLDVASSVNREYSNRNIIYDEMKKLAQEFNENVVLHIYIDYSAMCIERIEAQNVVKISSEIGSRTPLYAGASGKLVLAYQSPEIIKEVINRGFTKYAENTITDGNVLLENLSLIKKLGYSISFSEIDEGVLCISVPIIDDKGEFLSGLSIVAPTSRMENKNIEKIKNRLLDATKNISAKIRLINN